MRRGATLAISLAVVTAIPFPAQARSFLGTVVGAPLAIIGGIAGAAIGARAARARHRPQQAAPSRPATVPRTIPVAQQAAAHSAWSSAVYWPYAYDSMFDAVFGSERDNNRFWSHGYGDILEVAFAPPGRQAIDARVKRGATKVAMNDTAVDDGKPMPAWEGLCGSESSNGADAIAVRIRLAVEPTEAQATAFHDLQSALSRAFDRIKSTCPATQAVAPGDRLNAMISRLTAMGQAALTVRAPLRTFYDTLSPEQKAALEAASGKKDDAKKDDVVAKSDPAAAETTGSATKDNAADNDRAPVIAECSQPAPEMPMAQMSRAKPAQREGLERFQAASKKLAAFVATTCPTEPTANVVDRLDAVKSRISVLRYAALNMSSAVTQMSAAMAEQHEPTSKGRERRK